MTMTKYLLIPFPYVQKYMEEEWFEEEAIAAPEDSGYFIPEDKVLIEKVSIENNTDNSYPNEIKEWIMDHQEKAGNPRDWTVFLNNPAASSVSGGFEFAAANVGFAFRLANGEIKSYTSFKFCYEVLVEKNFNLFFKKYPKSDIVEDTAKSPFEPITIINKSMMVSNSRSGKGIHTTIMFVICKVNNSHAPYAAIRIEDYNSYIKGKQVEVYNFKYAEELPNHHNTIIEKDGRKYRLTLEE